MELFGRFFQDSNQSYFLFGPRGVGKSTWVNQQFPQSLYIDLLDPEVFRSYASRPERLREIVEAHPSKRTVIIDEIQKTPQLLDVVHQMLERRQGLRFILTGSSSRKLKRVGVDLLAGRALNKTMHPFMAAELGKRFSLENALTFGLVPLVVNAANPIETISAYAGLYIKEEVQQEGLVRNIGDFSRFLEVASFSHTAVLNVAEVARDCHVGRKTVEGYFTVLQDLLLAFKLPVFRKRAKRIATVHPKFFFFDTGVFRSLRPAGPLDAPQEIEGAALEGLVAQHLRAWIAYGDNKSELYFWRTKSGNEVDFIVYGPNTFYAIEVKNTARLRPKAFSGLRAFKEDYPEADAYLLYRGKEHLKRHNILCLPCEEFLTNLVPNQSIRLNI